MAENSTKIVLTAEDRTTPALQSVTRGLQGMQSQADLAGRALGALGVTFSAAAAVAFVKGTIDAADGMNDLSQKVGIGIRQLAGWTLAANQSGTSMESVAKGIKGLSTYMVEHGDRLRAAGVTATDANGAMIQLADIFKAMPDGVEKAAMAVKLFGKAGLDMLPMLNMGSAGLQETQEKADAYGKKMAELAPHADKFNDEMETLGINAKVAAMNIMDGLIPALAKYAEKMTEAQKHGAGFFGSMTTALRTQGLDMMPLNDLRKRAGVLQGNVSYLKDSEDSPVFGAKLQANRAELKMIQEEIARRLNVDGGMMAPYAAGSMSAAQAKALAKAMGGDPDPAKAPAAYKRSFDPEGDLAYARAEREFQEGKKRAIAVEKEMAAQAEKTQKEMDALDEKARKMDEAHMARMESNRIESEGEEAIRLQMEKTSRELEKQKSLADDLGLSFTSAFEDAVVGGKDLSDALKGLSQDVGRIIMRKSITEPLGNAVSGMVKESGVGDWFKGLLKFDGGGFTGGGARSGGLDGQGGFLAMMHPQETVIDHTRGGSGGGTQNHFTVDMRGASVEAVARLERLVASVNGSIERRAMGVMSQARVRGA